MPMYGIRDRSPFVQYNTQLKPSKQGTYGYDVTKGRRYYSSIDAEVYFGNHFVDEIVQIGYQVEQSTMPLFGYNAYVFDEVALGSRIINGQFTINFTRPGYLFELLRLLNTENVLAQKENVTTEEDGMKEDDDASIVEKTNGNAYTTTNYENIHRSHRPLWYTGFDINVMFGQEDSKGDAKHVMLEGVHIMSSSVGLDTTGQPITETYSFLARDIRPIG